MWHTVPQLCFTTEAKRQQESTSRSEFKQKAHPLYIAHELQKDIHLMYSSYWLAVLLNFAVFVKVCTISPVYHQHHYQELNQAQKSYYLRRNWCCSHDWSRKSWQGCVQSLHAQEAWLLSPDPRHLTGSLPEVEKVVVVGVLAAWP